MTEFSPGIGNQLFGVFLFLYIRSSFMRISDCLKILHFRVRKYLKRVQRNYKYEKLVAQICSFHEKTVSQFQFLRSKNNQNDKQFRCRTRL